MKVLSILLGLACAGAPQGAGAPQDAGSPRETGSAQEPVARAVSISVGGEPFTVLHLDDGQSPYLYPLLGPGGVPVTRGFPMDPRPGEARDHPHHRSMWLTHGDVNGWDFWHEGERHGRIRWTGELGVDEQDGAVLMTVGLEWAAGGEVLLSETRRMRFAAEADTRRVDVESELVAVAAEVTFGDTKEGSFALRLRPELRLTGDGERAAGTIVNSGGERGSDVWGKRAKWVLYSAPVEGRTLAVAILEHPSNPRHPTWWHARSYGLFAANPFGVHDFEGGPKGAGDLRLEQGERLVLRYRVVLHDGALEPAALDAELARYAAR